MKTLNITVNNKIATYNKRGGAIVCGNSDYQIKFTFDDEWGENTLKKARFKWNGVHEDVIISNEDGTCPVPVLKKTTQVEVGVFIEGLSTTTDAVIPCRLSALCDDTVPADAEAEDREYASEAKEYASQAAASANSARADADRAEAAAKRAESAGAGGGTPGEDGATFTPSVSTDGVISWTNDKGLPNPPSVNIKGDPYTLTEADKAEITASLSQVETPKIVSSVDEMTDVSKHYVLNSTGTIWAHRTTTKEGETVLVPNFTNLIEFDASGNPTNVILNKQLSGSAGASAGYMTAKDGAFVITNTSEVRGTSITFHISKRPAGQSKVAFFKEDGVELHSDGVYTINSGDWQTDEISGYKCTKTTNAPLFKFSAQMVTSAITASDLKDLIVTANESITYTEQKTEGGTISEWYDTGISYAPTFKTDLIGVLGEGKVIYLSDNNLPSGTYTLKYPDNDYAVVGTLTV